MLSGPELGDALKRAMEKKKVGPSAVATAFGVKPPSVSDWCNYGRIHKKHLERLVEYFSDVVGPDHWGLAPLTNKQAFHAAAAAWRTSASPRSQAVIDNLTLLAKKNALKDEDWQLIQDLAARFRKKP